MIPDTVILLEEPFPPLRVAKVFNESIDILVVEFTFNEGKVLGCFLLHLVFEEQLQEFDIFDDGVDLIAIKGESLLKLVAELSRQFHFRQFGDSLSPN